MKLKWSTVAGLVLNALLFIGAIAFLIHTMRKYEFGEIFANLSSIDAGRLFLACVCSLLSYLILSLYDLLALKYIDRPIKWQSVFHVSFIANALSNSIGLAVLSGSSLRLRLYSKLGVTSVDIVKVIAFYNLTFLIGFSTMAGVLLMFFQPVFPEGMSLTAGSLKLIGAAMLLFAFLYLILSWRSIEYFKIGKWTVTLPPLHITLGQIAASSLDWFITGAILYFLLPAGFMPFILFSGIFLTAHIAGTASNIPGGLGVFEVLLLFMLAPFIDEPTILGAIVLYRVIYYLVPLALGVLLFCIHEATYHGHEWRRITGWFTGRNAS